MNTPYSESIGEAFGSLTHAWKAKDFDLCKNLLTCICNNVSPDELEDLLLNNIDAAMGVFELFVKTGLDNADDDTPARNFYLRIVRYIIENENPEIKQAFRETFNHFFPGMVPVGFNGKREKLYSLNSLADGLGVSVEGLLSEAEKLPDVKIFSTEIPEGSTIH
jgi:hypothetical protein